MIEGAGSAVLEKEERSKSSILLIENIFLDKSVPFSRRYFSDVAYSRISITRLIYRASMRPIAFPIVGKLTSDQRGRIGITGKRICRDNDFRESKWKHAW